MRLRRLTLTCTLFAAATLAPVSGLADTPTAASGGSVSVGSTGGVSQADLDALRYYRSSGQSAKYDAELRRLQRLHPGWTPPAMSDTGGGGGSDVQALWDLLGAGRYAELEAAIAERRQRSPGWAPPAKLTAELEAAIAAERLVNASEGQQWQTVVRIADANPALLTCQRVDLAWRTAEAEAELGARAAAEGRYRGIVETCPDRRIRLATVQKAKAALGLTVAERLIALERGRPDSGQTAPEDAEALAEIERGLARGRLAAAAAQGRALPADELARLQEQARREQDAALATNLGWYDYNAGRPGKAATWFGRAQSWQPSAEAVLGLILAKRDTGDWAEAERLGAAWQARGQRIREVYTGMILTRLTSGPEASAQDFARYAAFAETARSADLADALGWRAYADGAYTEAADWFAQSLAWGPSRKAAEGRVLALRQAGQADAADAALDAALADYPDLAEALPRGGLSPALAEAVAADDYGACVRAGRSLQQREALSGADAQQLGWCLLALERPAEALRAFDRALSAAEPDTNTPEEAARLTSDARLGRAYAQLGLGQSLAVAGQLARGQIADPKSREIRATVLAQFAVDALRNERYRTALAVLAERRTLTPPTRDLRALEGWALYHLHDNAAAERIFNQLNAEFSTEETRHALRVVRTNTYRR